MVKKEEDKTRSADEKKKKEKKQILQRSEIKFEVGKKKTYFFGDTDSKEKGEENGLKTYSQVETKGRYQNRPQEVTLTTKEEGGAGGDITTEIKEDPRSMVTATAGEKANIISPKLSFTSSGYENTREFSM